MKATEVDGKGVHEKTSAVIGLIGSHAPNEVRQAWSEAEKEMDGYFTVGGYWVSSDGEHSFMTQMGI